MNIPKKIEVSRSYSHKIQIRQFEPVDVFASRKAECSPEEAAEVSAWLYKECINEVEAEIRRLQEAVKPKVNDDIPF